MLIDKFREIFNKSKDKKEYILFVKKLDKKRKLKTIERDYYRLRKTTVQKQVKQEIDINFDLTKITHLRRLKLEDFIRYKIKITPVLLQKEGFTEEEINIILKKN